MYFSILIMEQHRRSINVQQTAEALRSAQDDISQRYAGSMLWKARNGQDYLYRHRGKIEKSLDQRGPETKAIYKAFTLDKEAALLRASTLRRTLEDMAPVNRAMGLGRVPQIVARILCQLGSLQESELPIR